MTILHSLLWSVTLLSVTLVSVGREAHCHLVWLSKSSNLASMRFVASKILLSLTNPGLSSNQLCLLQLSQHMKLKLQFTASVSNPPPDARPLSRKSKIALLLTHLNSSIHLSYTPAHHEWHWCSLSAIKVKTAHPAQRCETCWTGTRPVWVDLSPSPTSSHLDPISWGTSCKHHLLNV